MSLRSRFACTNTQVQKVLVAILGHTTKIVFQLHEEQPGLNSKNILIELQPERASLSRLHLPAACCMQCLDSFFRINLESCLFVGLVLLWLLACWRGSS